MSEVPLSTLKIHNAMSSPCREHGSPTTQGPSLGYSKSQFLTGLSTLENNFRQNGFKNGQTAPRTGTGYPHEGPFVAGERGRNRLPFKDFRSENGISQGQNLALIGVCVPASLGNGTPKHSPSSLSQQLDIRRKNKEDTSR